MILLLSWTLLSFIAGTLPFSVWIGRWLLGKDIRNYGDANPGATNVMRAGGKGVSGKGAYVIALLLDFAKGAIPVGLARTEFGLKILGSEVLGIDNWGLVMIALAPILGHAFSPILGFRGGKAVAVTAGVWCALTAWEAPMIGGMLLTIFTLAVGANGWAVLGMMISMLIYFVITPASWNQILGLATPARPDLWSILIPIWLGNFLIVAWKHRADLAVWPGKL